jgi:hypothetical protein
MNKNVGKFISDLVITLISNGITVKLDYDVYSTYEDGKQKIYCEGWFDDKSLICSTKHPLEFWVPVFAHEFCHYLQWKEKSSLYTKPKTDFIVDAFIDGKKAEKTKLERAIYKVQTMELDCEKRSVELMKNYNLPFDFDRIIQRANAYIYFYSIAIELGDWYKTSPSLIKEIVNRMPAVFLSDTECYRGVEELKTFNLYKKLCMKKNQENEDFK